MAVLPLSKVIAGMKITAKGWNAMIDAIQDVTVGHTHTGSGSLGARVSHGNLTDAAIAGTTNSHAQLDTHVAAADGQHGLPSGTKVTGVQGATQLVCVCGSAYADSGSGHDVWKTISTGLTSLTSIQVTISCNWRGFASDSGQDNWWVVYDTGGDFDVHFKSGNDYSNFNPGLTFFWQAWGEP